MSRYSEMKMISKVGKTLYFSDKSVLASTFKIRNDGGMACFYYCIYKDVSKQN